NDFEIFIDPNGDTHNYYEIEVNALNTIWDLLLTKPYRDRGLPINTWDVKDLKTAVHTEGTINDPSDIDNYWSVELALPWSSLEEYAFENNKPKDGEKWRMNFSRVQWRLDIINETYQKQINPQTNETFPEYNWVWSPQGIINMHYPETWGYVQFSEMIVGHNKAEFVFSEEELIKWELRKIYYAQKDFNSKNGQYANKLESLDVKIENCNNPSIAVSAFSNGYEASLKCDDSSKIWYIRQDSKVWFVEE
ncbi:MAG: carbohydrate-binding family 9-like protein, partial [Cyclobacteriaceae bacterium]|nr:carbohydrate-binding family 9-like protein [Cyclobacteriaceae bacterium]